MVTAHRIIPQPASPEEVKRDLSTFLRLHELVRTRFGGDLGIALHDPEEEGVPVAHYVVRVTAADEEQFEAATEAIEPTLAEMVDHNQKHHTERA